MKLLVALPRFPWPTFQGDRLRAWHQLQALAARGHVLHVITFADEPAYRQHLPQLSTCCRRVEVIYRPAWRHWLAALRGLFSGLPFEVEYYRSAAFRRRMAQLLASEDYDGVLVQLARLGEAVSYEPPTPRVLDYMDAFSARLTKRAAQAGGLKGWFIGQEAARMARYEARLAARFDELAIISAADAALLPAGVAAAGRKLHIWPNGIAPEFFATERAAEPDIDLIFTGNLSYHPNVAAAVCLVREVLPRLRAQGLRPLVYLVGTRPTAAVQALAGERVVVTGHVPDVRPYLGRARVFVAPLFLGSGLQNKLLEAMAAGLPVVSTPLANAALEAEPGIHLLTGSDAAGLAAAVAGLLADPQRAAELGQAGRNFVRARFDWGAVAAAQEAVFQGLDARRRA